MKCATSTNITNCVPTSMGNSVITLTFLALPFHILVFEVLLIDLRLALPRHMITLSLSVSDILLIFNTFLCMAPMKIFKLAVKSGSCHVLRCILYFNFAMTLTVSSLSLIMLSLERYVACVHCFHLHHVFTRVKTIFAISCVWLIGIICGAITAALSISCLEGQILDGNWFMKIILAIIPIPTSVVLSVTQYRLFELSREKLRRVRPETMVGAQHEMVELRKKQVKIAFVASIVVAIYIISMLPAGCLSILELTNEEVSSATIRGVLRGVTVLNNIADPYIYGLGIADTRKAVIKNLKKVRKLFF